MYVSSNILYNTRTNIEEYRMNMPVEEIKDFIKKEYELKNHHAFLFAYPKGITVIIDPHLICKATNKIEDDESLNDTMQYWVEVIVPQKIDWKNDESAKWAYPEGQEFCDAHDIDLDCGGFSYEEVIINAHALMTKKYGITNQWKYDTAFNRRMKELTVKK